MTIRREQIVDRLTANSAITGGGIQSLRQAVRVAMTAATSGSNGIQVLNDADLNMGTNDFTLHWEGALPDYTPSAISVLMAKRRSSALTGFIFSVDTTGALRFLLSNTAGTALLANVLSTVVLSLANGEYATFSAVVTRETESADGSLVFYVNGVQLGDAITITAAATTSIDISNSLFICGSDSGVRYASDTTNAIIYNRALSAAEVLSLCVDGPELADIGASQTELSSGAWINTFTTAFDTFASSGSDSFTASDATTKTGIRVYVAAPVKTGKSYSIEFTPTFTNATLVSITASTGTSSALGFTPAITSPAIVSGQKYIVEVAGPSADRANILFNINTGAGGGSFSITDFSVKQIGITGQWNAENAQSNTGQIFDSSGNKNHALLPAAGATIIGKESAQLRQVRWTNTWDGTNELQYIGGVNQAILPANAYIESIVGTVTGATPHDIIIGDGVDADRYVVISGGGAGHGGSALGVGTFDLPLANQTTDGTNLKLTVDPDTDATMSIAWVITYSILE